MARCRIVKPEFFGDVVLSEVGIGARLLYIGLWQHMDRRGLMEYHPKLVKRDIFAYDDAITSAVIEDWVNSLVRVGRLHRIEHQGKTYLSCPTLPKHQHFHHAEKPNHLIPDLGKPEANPRPVPPIHNQLPEASPGQAPDKPEASPTDTDTDTDTDTEAVGITDKPEAPPPPLSEIQIEALGKQFGPELVVKHVWDAVAHWETKDAFQKQKTPLILTVQRYLRIEREKEKERAAEREYTPEEMERIRRIEAGGRA